MRFEAIHFADRLRLINPEGDVGVVTLWSPVPQVLKYIQQLDETLLTPTRSRIAVIANLYGDGLAGMMCNLFWNPQIRWIFALGKTSPDRVTILSRLLTTGLCMTRYWSSRMADTGDRKPARWSP